MSDQKYHQTLTANRKLLAENKRLKAKVERLRKAGDVMAKNLSHINWNICVEEWNAAKNGKQS